MGRKKVTHVIDKSLVVQSVAPNARAVKDLPHDTWISSTNSYVVDRQIGSVRHCAKSLAESSHLKFQNECTKLDPLGSIVLQRNKGSTLLGVQ
jgi:hypothetical protein